MKILKIVFGILGTLFALSHLLAIFGLIGTPTEAEGVYAFSGYMGRIAGICIGGIVAGLCFRPGKQEPTAQPPPLPEE